MEDFSLFMKRMMTLSNPPSFPQSKTEFVSDDDPPPNCYLCERKGRKTLAKCRCYVEHEVQPYGDPEGMKVELCHSCYLETKRNYNWSISVEVVYVDESER
jgi:hypothetical protein